MERALQERMIGAIVLVTVAVLVVPIFLDGDAAQPTTVSERVPLPGQTAEQPVKTVILDRDRAEPMPSPATVQTTEPATDDAADSDNAGSTNDEAASSVPAAAEEVADTAPVVEDDAPDEDLPSPAERAADSAPVTPTATPVASATGMWAVQLGSFSNEENANRLAADLRQKGFAAFLSRTQGGTGELHRVRIGPQKDRPDAEAMARRLAQAGMQGQVVPHP